MAYPRSTSPSNSDYASLFGGEEENESSSPTPPWTINNMSEPQLSLPSPSLSRASNLDHANLFGDEDEAESLPSAPPSTTSIMSSSSPNLPPPSPSLKSNPEFTSLFGEDSDEEDVNHSPLISPTPQPQSSPTSSSKLASLFGGNNEFEFSLPALSIPSPNPTPTPNPKPSSTKQQKLSALLAKTPQPTTPRKKPNEDLTTLRQQLEILVSATIVTPRIRDAKSKIIRQIQFLEEQEKEKAESEKRGKALSIDFFFDE